MALATISSTPIRCHPKTSQFSFNNKKINRFLLGLPVNKNCFLKASASDFPYSIIRFSRTSPLDARVICAASSAAGSSSSDNDLSPYEVLGVNPIEGFDMVKTTYTRKRKEAEKRGDEATVARLEKAYDNLMMAQLTKRKKGVTFGSFKV
ncbi:unnamed protein product [Ilex paraguariensis]|uniref:Uncharacterized protein n=1 Tax=Ilex paraguariensis TaxID=185542 RepID=A0ABC8V4P4_9AQUA